MVQAKTQSITPVTTARRNVRDSSGIFPMLFQENKKYQIYSSDSEDFLKTLPANCVDVVFSSPEPIRTYDQFLKILLILGQQCKRVLKPTGSMWINMEDAFNDKGSLMRWPARFSVEMVETYEWILRAERIWHLPVGGRNFYNSSSDSAVDNNRLILDHSYVFHFTTCRYGYYNSFDTFGGQPCSIFTEKSGPRFSLELIKQSLLMSCPDKGIVMDPFCGAGATTGIVALAMGDKQYSFIGIEKDSVRAASAREILAKHG